MVAFGSSGTGNKTSTDTISIVKDVGNNTNVTLAPNTFLDN